MKLKVGVVGCGGVAQRWHLPALSKISESWPSKQGIEFVACCDLIQEKADAVAKQYGVRPYTDPGRMLAEEELDLVMVLTREQDRARAAITALKAGVNVFCEKAISDSIQKAEEIVRVAAEMNCVLGVNFNYRFSPPYMKLKEMISSGKLGEPCFISFLSHGDCYHHIIDLNRYFMGEVKKVYARYLIEKDRAFILGERWLYTASRFKMVTFEFENGFAGDILGSDYMSYSHPLVSCTYAGTKGRATIPDIVGKVIYMPNDGEVTVWRPSFLEKRDFSITFENSIRAFIEAILRKEKPPVTGLDGLRALQIEEAILLSQEKGIPVKPY